MVEFTPVQYVEIVDVMGSDETVARAARVSTGRDQLDQGKITGLIGYLARSGHTSCFEHCTATFRIECPIFVARQVMRHRVFSYNEKSLRYTEAEPRFYIPGVDRPLKNAGSSAHPHLVDDDGIPYAYVLAAMTQTAADAYEVYKEMIETGVAQEVARSILPVSTFTAFYMTGNLNNWAKFLKLRNGSDGHPQHEIQDVAQQIEYVLHEQFPVSMAALMGENSEIEEQIDTDLAKDNEENR